MTELLKTTKNGKGYGNHDHIVYLRQNGGITSVDNKHSHNITLVQPDEEGNPGYLDFEEANGHTHQIIPYETKELTLEGDEKEIIESVIEDWFQAKELEKESINAGYESEDFYMHRQWKEADVKKLKAEDRAVTTVNKAEKAIDNLSGYQRQNRTDIKYLPQEGGDQRVADILNHVSKFELDACFYPREETKTFEDATIIGRGLFHDYTDYNADFRGKIVIERFKWDECNFFAHEKEDLSDCDGVIKHKWFSEAKIKQMYPEKADMLYPEQRQKTTSGTDSEDWDKRLTDSEYVNKARKEFRVLEREKKIFRKAYILVHDEDEFVFNADGWEEADVNRAKSIAGFSKITRITYTIRITKVAGRALLEDYWSEDEDFSITPLYAKFRNNEFWGKIEGIKDLCRLINRTYSQFVDIINKVANYGWFFDTQTFPDAKAKRKWKTNAAKPGFNQEIEDVNRPPKQVEGVKFPVEIVNAIAQFNNDLREIMNINLEMLGMNSQAESGVAIRQKIAQQLIGNDFLFDNLSFVKQKLGRKVVKKIQKLYTTDRILRIIANQNRKEEVQIAGEPFEQYSPEDLYELLEEADLSLYDVVVSESPSTPSAMMGNFLMMMELAGKGIDIPPEAVIEFAPIPEKEKVKKLMAESAQAKAASEKMKYDTEIQKTLINAQAKGGDTGGMIQ